MPVLCETQKIYVSIQLCFILSISDRYSCLTEYRAKANSKANNSPITKKRLQITALMAETEFNIKFGQINSDVFTGNIEF
jgi:hypothetical protein